MKLKFTRFLIFAFFLFPFFGFSQGEWKNWYFGSQAGVTFNGGSPQYLMDSPMATNRSMATVSDSLGNLLFVPTESLFMTGLSPSCQMEAVYFQRIRINQFAWYKT